MKRLLMVLIAGLFLMVGTTAYAANATDTIGATITGSKICTLAISSSDLSVTAPTEAGPQTTLFTNSPVAMAMVDNSVDTVTSGTDILSVQITSSPTAQYGTANTYYIELGAPTFTPDADSELTAGEVTGGVVNLNTSSQMVLEFGTASGKILAGSLSQAANLKVNTGKRAYGDTSESLTITYTLTDN